MAHGDDLTTQADIDAALERAKQFDHYPRILSAEYQPAVDAFLLRLDTKRRFFVPREDLEGLENATPAQLSEIEIYAGLSLAWPQLDVDHYLPYILQRRGGAEQWMHAPLPDAVAA